MQTENSLFSTKIPARIARLAELAYNFWWSWHRQARDLFKMLDYPSWSSTGHNPVKMLLEVSSQRLAELAADPLFLRQYDAVLMAFDRDLKNGHLWFPGKYPDLVSHPVAYFSPEFGLHQSLPIYSGGLGVLAGDHCKEASDLGIPFVAVGFLYEMGYFRQHITADGWQEAIYSHIKPDQVAVRKIFAADGESLCVPVEVGDRTVHLQVWHVQAGRTQLYLMDADNDLNAPWDRELTARLYGGGQEMRIQQEIVLGIGGMRVLRALEIDPVVFHLNEGHSAFLVLERAREMIAAGQSFDEARESVRATTIFTTHTPVPAGHDVFPFHMIEKYFHVYWSRLGLSREQFLALGSHEGNFNMTVLALGMAGRRNGVSKLHGEVSRRMFHSLWPDRAVEDVPITHITNGIHVPAWIGGAMNRLYRKYLGPDWIEQHDDPVLWERILLHDRYRPVQFIFAGKAHPADEGGKQLIQHVYNAAKDPAMGGRIAFVEDYDLQVARYLVQGVDVWLNTPRLPREASGTSGQKAAINGVPNLSVLDGWWAEGYNGANGWAIGDGQQHDDQVAQDQADADALYCLLEEQVAPLFYKRDAGDVPRGWVQVMKEAIRTSVPVFCTRRMVKEYTKLCYVPAAGL
ncbi:MAG: hypothetical protein B6I34_10785 [Anaerolineaceae bacterium 4572_32.1]|nr:MAG: hypothetical protein B6I34_10785 [Anaerolineaceae bacterium 4572_32.1]